MFSSASFSQKSFSPKSFRFDEVVGQQSDESAVFDAPYQAYVERIKAEQATRSREELQARAVLDTPPVEQPTETPANTPMVAVTFPGRGVVMVPANFDLEAAMEETGGALLAFIMAMLDD